MAFQGGLELSAVGIPQPNRPVRTAAGECFSIRREGHPPIVMAFQGGLELSAVGIPYI